jgi:hypothetical protein
MGKDTLRVGFDYHLAEVDKSSAWGGTWFAHCPACGWKGAYRDLKRAAEADALAHDTTENE